jgi:hypothetical protein
MHDTIHPETEPLEAGPAQTPLIVLYGSRADSIWRNFGAQLRKSQGERGTFRLGTGGDRAGPDDTQRT